MFCSHLQAAHAPFLARRNQDLRQLLAGLQLGLGTPSLASEMHHLFLLGDLNYRLQVKVEVARSLTGRLSVQYRQSPDGSPCSRHMS